ncbi:MAG: class II aldolase/adducin family protein [Nautiliaceae bacterium]
MVIKTIKDEYKLTAQLLYEKNMLNLAVGSISLKIENDKMIINNQNKSVYEEDFCKIVHINKKDLSWKETSNDIEIHARIYKDISYAKTVLNVFPLNIITYSLQHTMFKPIDYQGQQIIDKVKIIEIGDIQKWEENKEFIITNHLKEKNIVIIRGFGVFIIARDIKEAIKKAIILENSATILLNNQH